MAVGWRIHETVIPEHCSRTCMQQQKQPLEKNELSKKKLNWNKKKKRKQTYAIKPFGCVLVSFEK